MQESWVIGVLHATQIKESHDDVTFYIDTRITERNVFKLFHIQESHQSHVYTQMLYVQ
jgi:hypothetical protein